MRIRFLVLVVTLAFGVTPAVAQTVNFTFTPSSPGVYPANFYSETFTNQGCILSGTTTNANPNIATITPTSFQGAANTQNFTLRAVSPGTDTITINTTVTGCVATGGVTTINIVVNGPTGQPLQIPGGGGSAQIMLPNATASSAYSQSLPVSGGTLPHSWQLLGGALPGGLFLDPSGVVSGVPTQPGTAAFTAQVSDASGTADAVFLLTVAPQPLTITSPTPFPNGIVNSPFPPQVLTASGGTPPYLFQANNLPAGLTLVNGQISGTPTAAGNPTVNLTVTDSASPALTASSQFPLTVNSAGANLVLSQAEVTLSLIPASNQPNLARVSVESSNPSQPLSYSVSSPTVPGLFVTSGSSVTPGVISMLLNSAGFPVTGEQATVTVTCTAPSPCAGSSQTIAVKLNPITGPPEFSATAGALEFFASSANPQPLTQPLGLQNIGSGTIGISSVKPADSYISVTGTPTSIPAGPPVLTTVTVDPATLRDGFNQSSLLISTSAGPLNIPITTFKTPLAYMTLNPSGATLQATAGALPGNPNGSFEVSVSGGSSIQWTATLLPGANWLTLNTNSGSSTPSSPGTISFTVNSAATLLSPKAYYARIQVASGTVIDSPLTFIVVLNVTASTIAPLPMPTPAGLLFFSNGGVPRSQNVTVFASSVTPLSYQAASDSSWLSVSPGTGQTSSSTPGVSTISVNPSLVQDGIFSGNVTYALGSTTVSSVNVTLIKEPGVTTSDRTGEIPRANGCTPTRLVPTQTGLVNTFSAPAAWPTPLNIRLVDDCAQPVTNAQVIATFSNGDPPLILLPNDTVNGNYTATWTPAHSAQQIAVTAMAKAAGFPVASAVISGQVTPNIAPLLSPNGTINAFAISAEPGVPLAPGTIVQIYGSNLASQTTPATKIPLPDTLSQTSVIIGGIPAPLYYVSPGQINAEVPFELSAGRIYEVLVNANDALSTPTSIQLTADSPGIAQFPAGQIIAQHSSDGSLVTATAPAAPGEYIVMYLAGMGLTDQTVSSGMASPLANVLGSATLTLGGAPVTNVLYAGLTPTLVGLYQVNFQVPAGAPNGSLPLVLTQTSGVTNTTILPVHK